MTLFARKLLVNILSCNPCSIVARKVFGHGIPIFMMHRMREEKDETAPKSAISDGHLRRCLQFLKNKRYTFISIRHLATALAEGQSLPEKCAVFTMDDGFEDQARVAAPIYREFDCPATIFLITGMLDNQLWPWDDKIAYLINETTLSSFDIMLGDDNYHFSLTSDKEKRDVRRKIQHRIKALPFNQLNAVLSQLETATRIKLPESAPAQYRALSWEEARQYEKLGIEFGPHTISHPILSRLNDEDMKKEILGSWERLQTELSNPSPVFCYPTGRYCDFGAREIKLIRESGFIGGVSTIAGQVRPERMNQYYQFALPRYPLPSSFNEFKLYCSWFEYVRERNQRFWPR